MKTEERNLIGELLDGMDAHADYTALGPKYRVDGRETTRRVWMIVMTLAAMMQREMAKPYADTIGSSLKAMTTRVNRDAEVDFHDPQAFDAIDKSTSVADRLTLLAWVNRALKIIEELQYARYPVESDSYECPECGVYVGDPHVESCPIGRWLAEVTS